MTQGSRIDLPPAVIVSDQESLVEFCCDLSTVERFAFDAEFIGEDGYQAEVCLVQVATEKQIRLIDPLAGLDLRPFWDLVADDKIETVVHAGSEDLALGHQQTGLLPQNVFDIQLASGLVSVDYPVSLQRLARSTLGVRLHKSQTLTDWRKRPLRPMQIQYAVEDVGYMLQIHTALCRRLETTGRTSWAREEFARFGEAGTYRQQERDPLSRVRGVSSLKSRGLAIAKELAIERELLAKQHDRPPRALLKDHLLAAIAKHQWTSREDLMSLRGFTLRGKALQRIVAAVQRGLDMAPEECPQPSATDEDTQQEAAMCRLIAAVLFDYCQTHQIAFQLISSKKDIRALVWAHTRPPGSTKPRALQGGWRQREVGDLLDGVLAGRHSIRVKPGKDGFRLCVE